MKTFKAVYPNSYFFAVNSPASTDPQNIIFLGINGSKAADFNAKPISKDNGSIFATLSEKIIDTDSLPLHQYPEITDNFAPVEYLISKVIHHWY